MAEGSIRIPELGETFAGKYRLSRVLGEGGMGVVFAAEHVRLRQPIAIKVLNPDLLGVEAIVQRFDREARAAAKLRSRHVVRVTDVAQTALGLPYMVMELLEGSDLESERARRVRLPYVEVVDYVLQACAALAEAHDAGIVHRDLKPGNLFLAKVDGDRPIVKVLDFGISKFLEGEDAKLTSVGAIMGTALYMSPEQIRGDESIDARSDIWALGVILYELIGGEPPWTGPTTRIAAAIVSEAPPKLPESCPLPEPLVKTIHAMLAKRAADRPQSIVDVVVALAPFAPPGSVGAEVAAQLARRNQRELALSVPRGESSQGPVDRGSSSVGDATSAKTFQLGRSRSAPERSTMAATIASAIPSARPRALWGALAGLCALALAGVGLVVFVARAKPPASSGASAPASSAVVTAQPAGAAATTSEPEPTPLLSAVSSEPPVVSPETLPAASPKTPTPAAPPKKPTLAISSHKTAPAAPPIKTAARSPTPKPTETASSVVNPPFLK